MLVDRRLRDIGRCLGCDALAEGAKKVAELNTLVK